MSTSGKEDREKNLQRWNELQLTLTPNEIQLADSVAIELVSVAAEAIHPIHNPKKQRNSYDPNKPLAAIEEGKRINKTLEGFAEKLGSLEMIEAAELLAKLAIDPGYKKYEESLESALERMRDYVEKGSSLTI